jgi:hypothetical protein
LHEDQGAAVQGRVSEQAGFSGVQRQGGAVEPEDGAAARVLCVGVCRGPSWVGDLRWQDHRRHRTENIQSGGPKR